MIDADCMIMAIGTSPNPLIRSTTEGLETNRKGCLIVDENEMTTREGIYAGGDAVTGCRYGYFRDGCRQESRRSHRHRRCSKTPEFSRFCFKRFKLQAEGLSGFFADRRFCLFSRFLPDSFVSFVAAQIRVHDFY